MKVFVDNGTEKVASAAGIGAAVIVVNVADGTKSVFVNNNATPRSYQDVVPAISNGALVGFGVTGLDHQDKVPNGSEGCINSDGCGTIKGHISFLAADLQTQQWTTKFNDFPGGTGTYASATSSLSQAVIITECWGLAPIMTNGGNVDGFVAACGQGIEGCREYLTGIDNQPLNQCENDPRRTWRGAAIKVS